MNKNIDNKINLIDKYSYKIFNEDLIETGYDYYLSEYEGLFIKLIKISFRYYFIILLILLIPFIINYLINQNKLMNEIIIYFNYLFYLNQQNIFISFIQNSYQHQIFNKIKNSIEQIYPLTNFIFLYNITNIIELNSFISSKTIFIFLIIE